MFTADDFIQEAYKLAKPGVYLSSQGDGEIAAIWGGEGVVKPSLRIMQTHYGDHVLSVDARFLPHDEFSLTGYLSVYGARVAHDPEANVTSIKSDGIPLYSSPELLLAPPDYVCMAGSEKVKDWLRSLGQQPEWGAPNSGDGQKIIGEYERLYFAQPIYGTESQTSPYAYLGGYNFVYVDYKRIFEGESLVLCTLKDSEPWTEVWRDKDGNFEVVHQIT